MDPILNQFGYDEFREGQQEVIGTLGKDFDAIAILPTGNRIVYLSIYRH